MENNSTKSCGKRVNCAFIFLTIWGILFALFCSYKGLELIEILKINWLKILWCAVWGAFGIALGLWNSRTDNDPRTHFHYIAYYSFVWFFATILALAVSADVNGIRLYALSMVTALATGFAGDRLAGNIMNSNLHEKR